MTFLLNALIDCLSGGGRSIKQQTTTTTAFSEKDNYHTLHLTAQILTALTTADKAGPSLESILNDIITTTSWSERLAASVLRGIENVIREGAKMGTAMAEAVVKAEKAATGFAREHPAYVTLIAAGIVALMLPWCLELLGFAEAGLVEGKKANPSHEFLFPWVGANDG